MNIEQTTAQPTPPTRLECPGVDVEGFHIPEFTLATGEIAGIIPPLCDKAPSFSPLLIDLLSGRRPHPEIKICGNVHVAASYLLLSRRLKKTTTQQWLESQCRCSPDLAERELDRLSIPKDRTIASLPGNPRCALTLLSALHLDADLLVLSTAGMDPMGTEMIRNEVIAHRSKWAIIEVIGVQIRVRSMEHYIQLPKQPYDKIIECSPSRI